MGQKDASFYKSKEALNNMYYKGKDKSNSQLYKQAGNSIPVTVLEDIFEELFLKEHNEVKKIIVEEIPLFPGFESKKIGVGRFE